MVAEIDQPVRGDVIRNAIYTIDVSGIVLHRMVVDLLKDDGVILDSGHYYSLREIKSRLLVMFGESLTPKIVKLIEIGIREQYY